MKIDIINEARSVAVAFTGFDGEEYGAPYRFVSVNDALAYVEEQIDERQQYAAACIYDANTGEAYVYCCADNQCFDTEENNSDEDGFVLEGYDYDDYDLEMGFNPYLGTYDFDC